MAARIQINYAMLAETSAFHAKAATLIEQINTLLQQHSQIVQETWTGGASASFVPAVGRVNEIHQQAKTQVSALGTLLNATATTFHDTEQIIIRGMQRVSG